MTKSSNPVNNMPERMSPSEMPIERKELGLPPVSPQAPVKMFIKTISAEYQRKFNVGEYESATFGVSAWADLDPEENPDRAINELQDICKEHVRKSALPILRGRKNGGAEYGALEDRYHRVAQLLDEALTELASQEPHEEELKSIMERWNNLTKDE